MEDTCERCVGLNITVMPQIFLCQLFETLSLT